MPSTPPDPPPSIAASLALQHDAPTLAAALVARLLADGRAELSGALVSMLSGLLSAGQERAGLDPNPPDPHREGSTR